MKIIRIAKRLVAMPKRVVAMPWPKAEYPEGFKENHPELEHRLKEEIDMGEGAKYLGHGASGSMVYDIGGGLVAKLTPYKREHETAKRIMKLQESRGGSLSCVVHIYSSNEKSDGVYEIVSEKVRILNEKEGSVYDTASYILEDMRKKYFSDLETEEFTEAIVNNALKQYSRVDYIKGGNILKEENIKMMFKHMDLLKCLSMNQLPDHDLHENNIGFREDGTLVLLDIG